MLLTVMSTILISSETAALRGFYSKPKNPTIKTSKSDSRHRQKTDGDNFTSWEKCCKYRNQPNVQQRGLCCINKRNKTSNPNDYVICLSLPLDMTGTRPSISCYGMVSSRAISHHNWGCKLHSGDTLQDFHSCCRFRKVLEYLADYFYDNWGSHI